MKNPIRLLVSFLAALYIILTMLTIISFTQYFNTIKELDNSMTLAIIVISSLILSIAINALFYFKWISVLVYCSVTYITLTIIFIACNIYFNVERIYPKITDDIWVIFNTNNIIIAVEQAFCLTTTIIVFYIKSAIRISNNDKAKN